MYKKYVFILLSFILIIGLSGCGTTTVPEKVDNAPQTQQTQEPVAPENEVFSIGETVKMGSLQLTLNGARFVLGDNFFKPDAGTKWLAFDCTIENSAETSTGISSLLMFKLYDADNFSKETTWLASGLKGSLDGEIGAGRKMRGEIAFVVGENETEWEFIFEPSIFGYGQAIYEISIKEVN